MKTFAAPAPEPAPGRTLTLQLPEALGALIDRAAKSRGKTPSEFILDAAWSALEEQLPEQTSLAVDPETFLNFLGLLDAPPRPNERLRRTVQTPPPWSQG